MVGSARSCSCSARTCQPPAPSARTCQPPAPSARTCPVRRARLHAPAPGPWTCAASHHTCVSPQQSQTNAVYTAPHTHCLQAAAARHQPTPPGPGAPCPPCRWSTSSSRRSPSTSATSRYSSRWSPRRSAPWTSAARWCTWARSASGRTRPRSCRCRRRWGRGGGAVAPQPPPLDGALSRAWQQRQQGARAAVALAREPVLLGPPAGPLPAAALQQPRQGRAAPGGPDPPPPPPPPPPPAQVRVGLSAQQWITVYNKCASMKQRYHYNVTTARLLVHVQKGWVAAEGAPRFAPLRGVRGGGGGGARPAAGPVLRQAGRLGCRGRAELPPAAPPLQVGGEPVHLLRGLLPEHVGHRHGRGHRLHAADLQGAPRPACQGCARAAAAVAHPNLNPSPPLASVGAQRLLPAQGVDHGEVGGGVLHHGGGGVRQPVVAGGHEQGQPLHAAVVQGGRAGLAALGLGLGLGGTPSPHLTLGRVVRACGGANGWQQERRHAKLLAAGRSARRAASPGPWLAVLASRAAGCARWPCLAPPPRVCAPSDLTRPSPSSWAQVSDNFPYEWIKKKWREGFHVTAMATAAAQWAVVMSRNAGYSDQVRPGRAHWPTGQGRAGGAGSVHQLPRRRRAPQTPPPARPLAAPPPAAP
jgi:hypothetical protein